MRTAVTQMLNIDHPLVGFSRSPGVVAAVTNAGGLGVLAATAYTPSELDAQLTWIQSEVGGKPIGIDVLIPAASAKGDPNDLIASLNAQIPNEHRAFVQDLLARYGIPADTGTGTFRDEIMASINSFGAAELIDVAFSHQVALIANALGPAPRDLVSRGKREGVVVAALVGQAKHALSQIEHDVDLLIAQGTEAGGHTGTVTTMVLTPEIVDLAGSIPVLAAGGIASGRQMAAALALGASGVWCGSVWLRSQEDITPDAVKRKFLAAHSGDTVRSKTRTGKPARQLRSSWHDEWDGVAAPAPLPLPLQPLLVNDAWNRIDTAAALGQPGALELESFFVGQVVGRFETLEPASDIARHMIEDCTATLSELRDLAGS
jgi:NAD(P)H-dependent flavin oxidoreductase YrpB (nitropropane dioxygenase family)